MTFMKELVIMPLAATVEKLNQDVLVDIITEVKNLKEDVDFEDTLAVVRVLKNSATKAHIVRNDNKQSVVYKIEFANGNEYEIDFGELDDVIYEYIDAMPRVSRWTTLTRAVVVAMASLVDELESDVEIEDNKDDDFGLEFESMDEFKEIVTDIAVRALKETAICPEELADELVAKFSEALAAKADEVINEIAEDAIDDLDGCDGDCCEGCEEDCDARPEPPKKKDKKEPTEADIDELVKGFIHAMKSLEDMFGGK